MAYTPQTWADGSGGSTPITAARLAHIEQGVDLAHDIAEAAPRVVTVTTGSEARPSVPFVVWVCPTGITPTNAISTDLVRLAAITTGVVFTTTGATFAPRLELASGSSATATWSDSGGATLATGLTPTISFGTVATRSVRLTVSTPADVTTLNLGFNHNDDAGRDNLGAGYDYAAQAVSGVTGLTYLTGLRNFLAANGNLTGALDFTGLAQLRYVECFGAFVQSVNLTGCSNLIRLCLEHNSLTTIDLNPVRTTLRDFRAANMRSGSLAFTTLTGSLPVLWHYCIRDQVVTNIVPHSQLPAVEQYWVWNTAQTTSDAPTSTNLNSFLAYQNVYSQAATDNILTGLAAVTPGGGTLDIANSSAPSSTGAAARTTLTGRGWTITIGSGGGGGGGGGTGTPGATLYSDTFATASGLWTGGAAASYGVAGGSIDLITPGSSYQRAHNTTSIPDDVSVRATRTNTVTDATNSQFFGVFARWDGTNGVRVFHDASGNITVGDATGFSTNNITPTATSARPATWSTMRVDLFGGSVKVYLDATLVWEGITSIGAGGGTGRQAGLLGEPGDMDQAWTDFTVLEMV